jgi:hypothetical protein
MICGTLTHGIAALSPGLGSGGSLSRLNAGSHNMRLHLGSRRSAELFTTGNEI